MTTFVGNLAGNIASGMGGAIISGTAGAAGASNVNLYNHGNNRDEAEKRRIVEQLIGGSSGATLGDALVGVVDQFVGMMKHGAAAKMAEPPTDLIAQGIANGAAVIGPRGGEPPTAGPARYSSKEPPVRLVLAYRGMCRIVRRSVVGTAPATIRSQQTMAAVRFRAALNRALT
jgi:hypothetical protein